MPTDTGHTHAQNQSDYERVGGGPAIKAVVDRFYELLLADERLSGYFAGTDLAQLKRHQVLLISQVMGGPAQYDGRDLQRAHAGLDISSDAFTLVVSYLGQALGEAGVPAEIVARVGAQLAAAKADIVAAPAH
jgi:hemoglobin